jgi:hypothetical protein
MASRPWRAVSAELLAALDAASRGPRNDTAIPTGAATAEEVVRHIGVQLLGTASRPTTRLADRRHGVERLLQDGAVVDVGGAVSRTASGMP